MSMIRRILNRFHRKATQALYDQITELEQELKEFKDELAELKKPEIHIDLIDDSEMSTTPKSVRVNFFVWEEWQKFCLENEDYSKKQLVSMALKEFMNKHK